jgi:hypothetical protein
LYCFWIVRKDIEEINDVVIRLRPIRRFRSGMINNNNEDICEQKTTQ